VVQTTPDSGAVLQTPPHEAAIQFDEVIAERVAGTPNTIDGAVVLSPTVGPTRVSWKRTRLEVSPRGGFKPGRIYRLELLPVVTDLRTNRMHQGRLIVFSTGPEIPHARLTGAIVDWVAGHAAPRALVEAVLLPDSLPYRTVTDSTGWFDMGAMPAGTYLIYGIMDTNGDKRRGPREAFDTSRVEVTDSGVVELYAFVHDTIGPRVRQVETQDSMTVKVTFDRPIDPAFAFDTAHVALTTEEDSTTKLPVTGIFTERQLDSLRAAADSARRAARDTAHADTTRVPAAAPAPAPPAALPSRAAAARPPLDSTRAQKMIARRRPPTDVRFLRLDTPLTTGVRYVVRFDSVRGLLGALGTSRGQIRIAPRRVSPVSGHAPGARDTTATDTTRTDSTRVRPPGHPATRPPS
jgi:Big-like domain-containing protein